MKSNSTKSFTDMKAAMKNEAIMDARVEVYREVIEKQERLERLGIVKKMEDSVINDMKSELNKAVQGAKKAKLDSIRLTVKGELAEVAALDGCSHADLFAESCMENVNMDENGEIFFCDENSKMVLRDSKTGKPLDTAGLVKQMASTATYAPLFNNSNATIKALTSKQVFDSTVTRNPFIKGKINLTLQAKIIKETPELAEQMKKAAIIAKW